MHGVGVGFSQPTKQNQANSKEEHKNPHATVEEVRILLYIYLAQPDDTVRRDPNDTTQDKASPIPNPQDSASPQRSPAHSLDPQQLAPPHLGHCWLAAALLHCKSPDAET